MRKGIPTIEGWGNPSCIQSIVEETGETKRKLVKIGQIISQTFALGHGGL
jgi:hypothetical protein